MCVGMSASVESRPEKWYDLVYIPRAEREGMIEGFFFFFCFSRFGLGASSSEDELEVEMLEVCDFLLCSDGTFSLDSFSCAIDTAFFGSTYLTLMRIFLRREAGVGRAGFSLEDRGTRCPLKEEVIISTMTSC